MSSLLLIASCQQKEPYLFRVQQEEAQGYINEKGDTVIALGKYPYCFTDTAKGFAIVVDKQNKLVGIDPRENVLFEVYMFDNGPDYVSEGLFRIIKDGKIGYANAQGEIVIPPQYTCAHPFEHGKAQVATVCQTIRDGEHWYWESEAWMYIDKKGNKIAVTTLHDKIHQEGIGWFYLE
jgi:hypothetical protein